jgi:NAD-dependent SIR2 family protein deacetylase
MHNLINELINKNTENFHITQNIDGLHKNTENPNNVLELHGNIFDCGCLTCSFVSPTLDFYEKNKKEGRYVVPFLSRWSYQS